MNILIFLLINILINKQLSTIYLKIIILLLLSNNNYKIYNNKILLIITKII